MKRHVTLALLLGMGAACSVTWAQDDNTPPVPLYGTLEWCYLPESLITDQDLDVFAAADPNSSCNFFWRSWDPNVPARQALYTIAAPGDAIQVRFDIFDLDWLPDPNSTDPNEDPQLNEDPLFVRVDARIVTGFGFTLGRPNVSINVPGNWQPVGRQPTNPLDPRVPVILQIQAPEILGPWITRLIADQDGSAPDYDTLVEILITLGNVESPSDEDPRTLVRYLQAKNPGNPASFVAIDPNDPTTFDLISPVIAARFDSRTTSNGPAFADAGPDQTVIPGAITILDASDTFDGTNVGFDVDVPLTFAEDVISYSWEWIDGPTRLTPVQDDIFDPTATLAIPPALFTTDPNGSDEYTFRVTVSDNYNALTTSDTVKVVVQPAIENLPPLLVLERVNPLTTEVLRNETVIISAAGSVDLNSPAYPRELSYFWTQVDELGAPLTSADASTLVLPLDGVDTPTISFQALRLGEFFFRVTISDGELLATDTIGIVVTDQAVQVNGRIRRLGDMIVTSDVADGANDVSLMTGSSSDESVPEAQTYTPASPTALCGFGLMPLLVVPISLWLMRRPR